MDPDGGFWEDAERLFAEAIELDAADRAAFLDRQCDGHPDLRTEIESLIAAHLGAEGFLDGASLDVAEPGASSARFAGRTIGRFRLLEKIGEGGMGVVYRGERADGEFTQRVAVKLIDAPLRTPDAVRRFRAERQILATLNHPHIVTLHDGGVTDDGQAYLVMECIDGVPITRYCADHGLSLEARLQLFRDVCGAVQDAHQHAVVHRDLKPANILVTHDGVPKILDFGVAKLLDAPGADADLTATGLARPLTPNYASPEQLRGLPVTTASDIYALGVLLYELLAGVRPYDTTDKTLDQILAVVVDREPARPSSSAAGDPSRLPYDARRLRGDLDAIVLKAMSKEAVRRYASARELSEDVARHLAGEPVLAREPSFGYIAQRLAARHRAAFLSASASLIVIVAALTLAIWQARVATVERDRARLESAKANQVVTFLRSLFRSGAPSHTKGETLTVQDVLDNGVTRIEQELAGQPEVQATMLGTLGLVYSELSLHAQALPLLERSLALRERFLPKDDTDLAESLWALGLFEVRRSNYEAAQRNLERALRIRERAFGPDHPLLAEVLSELGNALFFLGKYEEGRTALRRAVAIEEKVGGARRLVYWLTNLSNLEVALDNHEGAQALLERALALGVKEDGGMTANVDATLMNLAIVLRQQEDFTRARRLFEEALAIDEKTYGPDSSGVLYTWGELGELFLVTGDRQRARQALDYSIRGTERVLGPEHHAMADPLSYYGRLLLAEGKPLDALIPLERALYVREKVLGGQRHNEIAVNLVDIAEAKKRLEGSVAAEPILRRALALQREVLVHGHRALVPTLMALGDVLAELNKGVEARAVFEEAVQIARAKLPPAHSRRQQAEIVLQRLRAEGPKAIQ